MKSMLVLKGLETAQLQEEGDLLVIRLPAAAQGRLLADETLRKDLAVQARALGFSRIALEITAA